MEIELLDVKIITIEIVTTNELGGGGVASSVNGLPHLLVSKY